MRFWLLAGLALVVAIGAALYLSKDKPPEFRFSVPTSNNEV